MKRRKKGGAHFRVYFFAFLFFFSVSTCVQSFQFLFFRFRIRAVMFTERATDGTLGPKRPPRKPYVVAARREAREAATGT